MFEVGIKPGSWRFICNIMNELNYYFWSSRELFALVCSRCKVVPKGKGVSRVLHMQCE